MLYTLTILITIYLVPIFKLKIRKYIVIYCICIKCFLIIHLSTKKKYICRNVKIQFCLFDFLFASHLKY